MAERDYSNLEITVHWDSDLCTHCESCWRGLPDVFNPEARPWVNMDGAPTKEIRQQVGKCPSGALSVVK